MKEYILPERIKLPIEEECGGCPLLNSVNYMPTCTWLLVPIASHLTETSGRFQSHYKRPDSCPLVEIVEVEVEKEL